MMRKLISAFLSLSLAFACSVPAIAVNQSEVTEAASYLRERGVMVGNQNGDMMLDSGLSRTELAVLLTRITVKPEHLQAEQDLYTRKCDFTDVPDWAKVYVGYCSFNGMMVGYGNQKFGAVDPVTPAAACTVILRYLGCPDDDWTYTTSCDKAVGLGLAPGELCTQETVTRGDMAVLLYRALLAGGSADDDSPEATKPEEAGITYNADGSINLPADGTQYIPEAGDVIRCDDGSNYTITDVSRWDKNMFASGPVGALPEPTCDWSLLPQPELPEPDARHFSVDGREYLFARNLYETRRMLYTLYNAIGENPETWQNGAPILHTSGNPKVNINLSIDEGLNPQVFWPWRESEIVNLFNSCPPGTYSMEAWDVYKDGVFQRTEYNIHVR